MYVYIYIYIYIYIFTENHQSVLCTRNLKKKKKEEKKKKMPTLFHSQDLRLDKINVHQPSIQRSK